MAIKEILAPVVSVADDEPALAAAVQLAAQYSAHAVALVVAVHAGSALAEEQASLSEVLTDVAGGGRAAARARADIAAWIERAAVRFDVRDVTAEAALYEREVLAHGQCADLIVLARGDDRAHRQLFQALLFGSGRPLLLMPPAWAPGQLGQRVLVAWDAKRAAARAVHDALPMLVAADEVVVATVDAKPTSSGHGEAPGREIAAHLARHRVNAQVRNLDSMGRSVERALLDEALSTGADMIVMGGYGHPRAQEILFGGVTRALSAEAPLPLLLSH